MEISSSSGDLNVQVKVSQPTSIQLQFFMWSFKLSTVESLFFFFLLFYVVFFFYFTVFTQCVFTNKVTFVSFFLSFKSVCKFVSHLNDRG